MSKVNYPSQIEDKLGFSKILENILFHCQSEEGRKQALKDLEFSASERHIQKRLILCAEMQGLLAQSAGPSVPEDISLLHTLLSKTGKEGLFLYEDELFALKISFEIFLHNQSILESSREAYTNLYSLTKNLVSLNAPHSIIQRVLDKEGKLRYDASPELKEIHQLIQKMEQDVRKKIYSKFELAKKSGWAGETEITIRNERLVFPVVAEFKKMVKGLVHDVSQSGKFLYIEPIECFEDNNRLKELYMDKKKAIEAVLRRVTNELHPYKDILFEHIKLSIQLDSLRARALFTGQINGQIPEISGEHADMHLIHAIHPLLWINLGKNNKKAVPLNFKYREGCRMLMVSGPNAGGKSIALKTIGLLQYMLQCGLPVPVQADSKFSVFKSIFIDIGDNQSLENNLSSYSSHLMNMKYFIEHSNPDTLFLIDEIGTGTDPGIGGSIARVILEELLNSGAFGVVTTHFGSLKNWAENTQGVQNGRMLYDLEHLEPLFILEPDKQGSSFALEVAGKAGISKKLLDRARKISRQRQEIDLDELLALNEKQQKQLSDMKDRLEEREKYLEKMISEYEQLKKGLESNKTIILKEAREKAGQLITDAQARIEKTIKVIQETKADKIKTKRVREDLQVLNKKLVEKKDNPVLIPKGTPFKPIPGEIVRHQSHKTGGEILEVKKDKAKVLFGMVSMWLPLSELEKGQIHQKHQPKTASFDVRSFEKQSNFRAELDLRGQRGEDAIKQLSAWLHDAHLLGMHSLRIIHGRGHGILRKLILEELKNTSWVDDFAHESEQLGGDGVTLVNIS